MMIGRGRPIGGSGEGEGQEKSYPGQDPLGEAYSGGLCAFGDREAKVGFDCLPLHDDKLWPESPCAS